MSIYTIAGNSNSRQWREFDEGVRRHSLHDYPPLRVWFWPLAQVQIFKGQDVMLVSIKVVVGLTFGQVASGLPQCQFLLLGSRGSIFVGELC